MSKVINGDLKKQSKSTSNKKSRPIKGQALSVISGLVAAIASLCGKYAMSQNETLDFCQITLQFLDEYDTFASTKDLCIKILTPLQITFFMCMFLFNCVMWTTFTKALRFSATSLEATIINTASNFFFTAVIGQVLFEEVVTSLWWVGTVLILCGLLIIHHSKNVPPKKPGTRLKSH